MQNGKPDSGDDRTAPRMLPDPRFPPFEARARLTFYLAIKLRSFKQQPEAIAPTLITIEQPKDTAARQPFLVSYRRGYQIRSLANRSHTDRQAYDAFTGQTVDEQISRI